MGVPNSVRRSSQRDTRRQQTPQKLHSSIKLQGVKSHETLSLQSLLSCWRSLSSRQRGHRWDKVIGELRGLHNEGLYTLRCSSDVTCVCVCVCVVKSRRMRLARRLACMGDRSGPYRVLVGRAEGKRPLGRPKYIWEYNIETRLLEVGLGGMDWFVLAQDVER